MTAAPRRQSGKLPNVQETFLDAIPFPIYVADKDSLKLVSVNAAMRRKTGAQPGDSCHWAIYHQPSPCSFCRMAELTEKAHGTETVFEHFNDRDECWYQVHESLLQWYDGRTVKHSIAVDIAGLKDAQNELSEAYALLALKSVELEKASITDTLTGLFNRRRLDQGFDQELDRAIRYGHPLTLILIDLDRFKAINDTHGHQTGDEVLQKVAGILRQEVRSTDTVGRWGGEEFLIICPETDLTGAVAMAEKLRSTIATAAWPPGTHMTGSFGIAQFRDGDSMKDLVARADAALYRAKTSGRNRVEV
jgi:diguanylate cyclase (GGDEF)-like protein